METKYCACCSEEIVGEVCYGDPWDDSEDQAFCSWECIEHCQEQQNEYLDSLDV